MQGRNKVEIMGNMVKDPDIRFTKTKKKVARITVASNYSYSASVVKDDGTRGYEKRADFIPIIAYGHIADTIDSYCKKGSPVLIDAVVKINHFDSKKLGIHVWQTLIIATGITLCGTKAETGSTEIPADAAGYPQQLDDTEPDFDFDQEAIATAAQNYAHYDENQF